MLAPIFVMTDSESNENILILGEIDIKLYSKFKEKWSVIGQYYYIVVGYHLVYILE